MKNRSGSDFWLYKKGFMVIMFFYSRKEAEKEAAKDALKNSKSFFFNFSINFLKSDV